MRRISSNRLASSLSFLVLFLRSVLSLVAVSAVLVPPFIAEVFRWCCCCCCVLFLIIIFVLGGCGVVITVFIY